MNKQIQMEFPGLQLPAFTGDLTADSQALLRANNRQLTADHSLEVAATCIRLAEQFGLDPKEVETAGLLHDIGGSITGAEMLAHARSNGWNLDPAEEKIPGLLHQRYSAYLAERLLGITNPAVLTALACHTTLRPQATALDMVLFLADKISWDQGGQPPYLAVLEEALTISLEQASSVFIHYTLEHDMVMIPMKQYLDAKRWLEEIRSKH